MRLRNLIDYSLHPEECKATLKWIRSQARVLRDPELIAKAQKGESVIEPVSGEELQSLAERTMVQPPDVVNQVKNILRTK